MMALLNRSFGWNHGHLLKRAMSTSIAMIAAIIAPIITIVILIASQVGISSPWQHKVDAK
jgi:hypothetical protein